MIGGSIYEPSIVTFCLLGVLVYLTIFPLIRRLRQTGDLLEPVVIFGGLFFLYYVVGGSGPALFGLEPAFPAMRMHSDELGGAFSVGLLVIAAGVGAFYFGYRKAGINGQVVPTIGDRRLNPLLIAALWALSLVCYIALLRGSVGANFVVYLFSRWHFYAVLAVAVVYWSGERRRRSVLGLLVGLVIVEVAIAGIIQFEMDQLLVLLMFLLLAYHYVGPGVDFRHIAGLGVAVALLFPISELAEGVQGEGGLGNFASGGFAVIHPLTKRMIGMDALTMIIARTPEPVPYQYGATLLNTVYAMIPSAIWPGKPRVVLCGLNNLYFSGRGADASTCAAMTLAGELYWNFGWVGVVVGLALFGALGRSAYQWFQRQRRDSTTAFVPLLIYGVVLVNLVRIENGTARIFSRLLKELLFAGAFLVLTTRPVDQSWGPVVGTGLANSRVYRLGKRFWTRITPLRSVFSRAWKNSATRRIFVRVRSTDSFRMTVVDGSQESVWRSAWEISTTCQLYLRVRNGVGHLTGSSAWNNSTAVNVISKLIP